MKIKAFLPAAALILLAMPASAASAVNDVRPGLAPHKAIYDIKMVSRHSGAQVLNVSGQMFFEGKITCDAWTTGHRFKLLYEYADSTPMNITSNFSTYETFDGSDFNFTSRRERNGEMFEEIRGHAVMNKNGTGEAVYTLPEDITFNLDAGSLFPAAHTETLLKQISDGKKLYSATVFDGSDQDGPVEISAFIGKPVGNISAIVPPTSEIDKSLMKSPAHAVRMAFFPLNQPESEADYEMDAILHDNGVISDMLIDYGDFSVTQKLVALEKLEIPACNSTSKGK